MVNLGQGASADVQIGAGKADGPCKSMDSITPEEALPGGTKLNRTATGLSGEDEKDREDYPMLAWPQGRLPLSKQALFGFPFFGWFAVRYMKGSYMKLFYVDDYPQASLGYIALFAVLGVLIDAFSDPIMANLSDLVRPRYLGRRRPFVLIGGVASVFIFTLSYMPLVPAGVAASIWFGVFHIGTKLTETVLMIPLQGWGAEMTPDCKERSKIWAWREIFCVVGILVGAVGPGFLSKLGGVDCFKDPGDGCIALPLLGFVFSSLLCLGCVLLVCCGRERPNKRLPPPQRKGWSDDGVVPTMITTWLNRPFKFVLISELSEAFGAHMPFTVLPFFVRVVLGNACLDPSLSFSLLAGVNLGTRMLSLPVWIYVGKRIGKFNALYIFNFLLSGVHFLFIFVGRDSEQCGQTYLAIVLVAIWGMVQSGLMFLKSVLSDIVDYDEFVTGRRREGQYLMATEFLPKFLEVPGEALPFLLMAAFGYLRPVDDGPEPQQPDAVVWLLRLCFSLVPSLFIFVGAVAMSWYPKGARSEAAHTELIAAIRLRHQKGLHADDPWFPGQVMPAPPLPCLHQGVLSHFLPGELLDALGEKATAVEATSSGETPSEQVSVAEGETLGEVVDYGRLVRLPLCWVISSCLFLVPSGVALMVIGWDDLSNDLGASVSPLGLILLGFAMLLVWFHGTRVLAAREVRRLRVPREDFIAQYNFYCRFTGAGQLPQKNGAVQPSVQSLPVILGTDGSERGDNPVLA
mmetsp:Transcript_107273/g.218898  ORF Transcript_107273/g.218898 Transcript_107273/m.218898 type:complete len:744 (+) Transcript_107273:143-2374(+)